MSERATLKRFYLYGKDDFGYGYDALSIQDEDGEWYYYEDVDAELSRLQAENDRLRAALEDLRIAPKKRAKYYSVEHFMQHDKDCPRGGDQCCPCRKAQTRFNIDSLLDAAEAAHFVLEGKTLDEAYKALAERKP